MTFTVEEFRDWINILYDHPEWREELRRLTLTDDILELPGIVRELAESQRELAESVRELTESQRELAEAQRGSEQRLTSLEKSVQALAESQRELAEAQRGSEQRLPPLKSRCKRWPSLSASWWHRRPGSVPRWANCNAPSAPLLKRKPPACSK